jgi:transcriptional regulator of acetoin/glycerol metabolism
LATRRSTRGSAAAAPRGEPLARPGTGDPKATGEAGEPSREQLVAALARAGGNKAEAARLLGVPRSTFFSRLKRHGLD